MYRDLRRPRFRRAVCRTPGNRPFNVLRPDFGLAITFLSVNHDPVTSSPVLVHGRWIRDIRCKSPHFLHARSGIMCRCGSATLSTNPPWHRSKIFCQSPVRSRHPRDWDKNSTGDQLRTQTRFFPLNLHGYAHASLHQSDERRETPYSERGPRSRASQPQPHHRPRPHARP
jgi:hypothetical protein